MSKADITLETIMQKQYEERHHYAALVQKVQSYAKQTINSAPKLYAGRHWLTVEADGSIYASRAVLGILDGEWWLKDARKVRRLPEVIPLGVDWRLLVVALPQEWLK